MPEQINNYIFLSSTNLGEITEILRSLPHKNSAGLDNISPKLLKLCCLVIAPTLTNLINASLKDQKYPDCLKITKIIPIFKSGNNQDLNNYRPISLLSSFNKVFEQVLVSRLNAHISRNNILFQDQFGFRKFHSTTHALISTYNQISTNLNNNLKCAGVFIDFQKAFDSLNHSILCQKLNYYGICGPFNKILTNYLHNRHILTSYNTSNSSVRPINYGIPQGSTLGPLLFLLYINDLKSLSSKLNLKLFADDTNLFISSISYQKLEEDLNNSLIVLNDWTLANKLTVNYKKTHYLIFKKKNILDTPNLQIKFGDHILCKQQQTKFLGLIIQDNLKWNSHINYVTQKINQCIPTFFGLRHLLNLSQLRTIYYALIYSRINYGIEIYGKTSKKLISTLQSSQNKIIKIILKIPITTPTTQIHKSFNTLTITDNIHLRHILLIHQLMYHAPLPGISPIVLTTHIHNKNTRTSKNIYLTTDSYNHSNTIIEDASIKWNALPASATNIQNRMEFKTFIFNKCIDSYI